MGKNYTETQKGASLTYQRKRAQIKTASEKEQREEIKKYAESKGASVTDLFMDSLKESETILTLYPERLPENIDMSKVIKVEKEES